MNGVQEYVLANGLKVLIKEDHSVPMVSQNLYYKVGSRNDPLGKTGLSHYLEHMQFNGTPQFPEISQAIESRGGSFNAGTGTDFTSYYITLPSEHLRFALELEADRMYNSILDESEAKREKSVVMAELDGSLNNPLSVLFRRQNKVLFPEHPYGDPIIGWESDVSDITVQDMREHYRSFYRPDNAVLVLVGDVQPDAAMEMIRDTLGKLEPPEDQKLPSLRWGNPSPFEPSQLAEQRYRMELPSESNLLLISWPVVSFDHPDFLPLNVLSNILTSGSLSRLEKRLVDTGMVSTVSSSARQGIDPFSFSILAATDEGESRLQQVEKEILAELEQIREEGVSQEELDRVEAKAQTGFLFGVEDPHGLASQLGFFEVVSGDWRRTFSWPEELESVTRQEVQRVASEYLTRKNLVSGKLVGKNQVDGAASLEALERQANYGPEAKPTGSATADEANLQVESTILDNGLRVVMHHNPGNPVIAVEALVDAGEALEQGQEELGIATMTAIMLERGTESHDRDQLSRRLENVGAVLDIDPETDYVSLSLRGRERDYGLLCQHLAELLRRPSFPEEELSKLKVQILSEMEQSQDDMGELGRIALRQAMHPPSHPYFEANLETQMQAIEGMASDKLARYHEQTYTPERTIIAVSGDVNRERMLEIVKQRFGDWQATSRGNRRFVMPEEQAESTAVDKRISVPGKTQALVYMGHSTELARSSEDFYAALLANDVLGGGSTLTSRLGSQVRGKAGLVYGINSSPGARRGASGFVIKMGLEPEQTAKGIEMSRDVIETFLEQGLADGELRRAKNYRKASFMKSNLTTNSDIASALAYYSLLELPPETINRYPALVEEVTEAQVMAAARKYFHPERLHEIVLVPADKSEAPY